MTSLNQRPYEIRIVLVRTLYERNIGAISRAMANMGSKKLILIDPQCEITYEAQQSAATGQYALQNRVVYKSWVEFAKNEPESFRFAFTARDGKGRNVDLFKNSLDKLLTTHPRMQKKTSDEVIVHMIFGPEDMGLSATDLDMANFPVSIATYGDNTSLNLGQAVLLALYILRDQWGGVRAEFEGEQKSREEQKKPASIFPDETLKTWLSEMGFDLSSKRINVYTILKRILLQNAPTTKEFRILETILQQSTHKHRRLKQIEETSRPRATDAP